MARRLLCQASMTAKASSGTAIRVLLVDEDPIELESFARGLLLYGYQCVMTGSVAEARAIIESEGGQPIDVLIADRGARRGCGSGCDLVREVCARFPDLPAIVIGGLTATPETRELERTGVAVLEKPFGPDRLDRAIKGALARRTATR